MPPSNAATVEVVPTGVAAGGDAVARDADGRVVFVTGALPGERVVAEIVDEHRSYARARVVTVVEPSPDRVAPPCPHVDRGCGGCPWQHVAPAAQPVLKAEIVADALRRLGGVDDPVGRVGPALPDAGHRTTVRLVVTDDGRPGYRAARSHDPVAVDSCLVAHPLLAELLVDGEFDGCHEVTLRCGARTGERLVLARPTAAAVRVPGDVVVVGDDELRAGRRAWFHEEVAGRRWRISARSFFQARPDGAEGLVDAVRAAIEEGGAGPGRLVDAYGGVGLFAGTVADGRPVVLVERSASAAADARVNLAGDDLTGAAGARGARILRLDVERWHPSHADVVVADPARTGLGRKAVGVLAGTGASCLVLVSCDPASLGRDTALLRAKGFRPASTTLVDLFPHTAHVEAVTAFTR